MPDYESHPLKAKLDDLCDVGLPGKDLDDGDLFGVLFTILDELKKSSGVRWFANEAPRRPISTAEDSSLERKLIESGT